MNELPNELPEVAAPVARLIRELVPRPDAATAEYIQTVGRAMAWRFRPKGMFGALCCPMGLLPGAYHGTPMAGFDLRNVPGGTRLAQPAIEAFGCWWDRVPAGALSDAIDLIWGAR